MISTEGCENYGLEYMTDVPVLLDSSSALSMAGGT